MLHLEEEQRDLLLGVLSEIFDDEVVPALERAQIREILEDVDQDMALVDDEQVAFLRDAVGASQELGLDERIDLLAALAAVYEEDE